MDYIICFIHIIGYGRTADNPNAEQVYYSRSTFEESIAVKSALFFISKDSKQQAFE